VVTVIFDQNFKKEFKKIKNSLVRQKIIQQVAKLKDNPTLGKPMRYARKGTRELYIKPFRLSYRFEHNTIYILDLYHKDLQ